MLKAAVIGGGNIGKHHTRIYASTPLVQLIGIVDTNEVIGRSLAKKYKTNYYPSFKDLIEVDKPNLVSICVPTSLHYKIAKEVITQKVNVLVEKPITLNLKEGLALIKLAKKMGVKLLVGHTERFNPAILKVKDMIKKGDLGKITAIMARRVGGFPPQIKDANIAIDLAIHDVDIVNYLLEETPVSVFSNMQKNHIENRADSVEIFMKYKKASAYIQANWITPVKIRKLNITGTDGYLELDYITQKIDFYKSNYSKFKEASKDFVDYVLFFSDPDRINISVAKREPLKEELLYFINCVENNIEIDTRYGIDALRIVLQ
jgi:UDP-N-acetylglucosamine 3-dehydrogenase